MEEKIRGKHEKITIDMSYGKRRRKQRVIQSDELKRVALIALSVDAVRKYLGKLHGHDRIIRDFEEGIEGADRGKASMVVVYDDGTYSVECDPHSHHPPESR